MSRILPGLAGATFLLLAACAPPAPEPEPLPVPPVPPARVPPLARPAAGTPPGGAEAAQMNGDEPEGTPEQAQAPIPVWRVARDGTLGCAEPGPLRLVRNGEDAAPRLRAQARLAGGCRTTFRRNEWAFEGTEEDLVRLRLMNGPALELWFLREDVVAP
ncbi:hypothetical protein [Roseomonas sp. HF4]|uniref:hypothetical protein n=1 Tax=Roseomonas sp. HF4 TaxID=2562313 RepID=UPI0010C009C6|nr:hypothetical protein [Roseomonas sp. HF4]